MQLLPVSIQTPSGDIPAMAIDEVDDAAKHHGQRVVPKGLPKPGERYTGI
jgi:hypothetical protein